MSVENFQQQLYNCQNAAQDPLTQKIAATANELTEMFKTGQLTKEEYVQIMADLSREQVIDESVGNMELSENINVAINGLINLAKLV